MDAKFEKTSLDERKEKADFLIESCNGSTWTIYARTFTLETKRGVSNYDGGLYEVSEKVLNMLKSKYSYECNF